jgi:N-acyl-D-amino-acid deacylase
VVAENLRRRNGPDAILIAHYSADPSLAGKTLTEIAKLKGLTPVRAAIELRAAGHAQIVSLNMAEPDIEAIMKAPFTMASSDAGLPRADRGVIRPGAFADLVIVDPAAVRDMATYAESQQMAIGVSHVFVNGLAVLDGQTFTEAALGRVLRKQ